MGFCNCSDFQQSVSEVGSVWLPKQKIEIARLDLEWKTGTRNDEFRQHAHQAVAHHCAVLDGQLYQLSRSCDNADRHRAYGR